MQILLFFFLLVFLIAFPVIFIILRITRMISQAKNRNGKSRNTVQTEYNNPPKTKKVFDKSEGEYVEYEEIEEDNDNTSK